MRYVMQMMAAVAVLSLAGGAYAVTSVSAGGLTFTSLNPADLDFTSASGTGTAADPIVLVEIVSGLDVNMSITGMPQIGDNGCPFVVGFNLIKEVTNNTGQEWNRYDHELQETMGVASGEGDGLSFAQGWAAPRPWTSSVFTSVDEIVDVRDYINFYDGVVADQGVVTFDYWITDNEPNDTIYLRQRPNYTPGGVIPEPMTAAGLMLGVGCLARYVRRRKSR